MRLVYAHDAVVRMSPAGNPDAIGAAVTVSLCGGWQPEPPCPAPHQVVTSEPGVVRDNEREHGHRLIRAYLT